MVKTDLESEDQVESTCHAKHGEAIEMFDKCLWFQQQPEASSYNASMA